MSDPVWPEGRRCAVSLTYDDGLISHREHVAPALSAHGLTGTFYIPVGHGGTDLLDAPDRWRAVADAGHELGNHSVFHPCRREPHMASWLDAAFDLKRYTPGRLRTELKLANFVLRAVDGRAERSYGNTCCNTAIGPDDAPESMDPILAELFPAARGPCVNRVAQPGPDTNWMQLGHFNGDRCSFEALRAMIEPAIETGGWAIIMFHGVGEGVHPYFVSDDAHSALLRWLGSHRDTVWTVSVIEAARHARAALGADRG